MLSKDIFVPLTICIDQTRRALVIVLPCYGALEIVGVIIIILLSRSDNSLYSVFSRPVVLRGLTDNSFNQRSAWPLFINILLSSLSCHKTNVTVPLMERDRPSDASGVRYYITLSCYLFDEFTKRIRHAQKVCTEAW